VDQETGTLERSRKRRRSRTSTSANTEGSLFDEFELERKIEEQQRKIENLQVGLCRLRGQLSNRAAERVSAASLPQLSPFGTFDWLMRESDGVARKKRRSNAIL
jgi:hypothetical protein